MSDSTVLYPLITLNALPLLAWFGLGIILQTGIVIWQQRQAKTNLNTTIHNYTIVLLLIFYWYYFLTIIYPTTIMPEILLPVTLFCSVIIVILLAVQRFVGKHWQKLLSFLSMSLALLLQLIIFLQPNQLTLPAILQLLLSGMLLVQVFTQARAMLLWLNDK
ncbi:MAG: hypothetical protein WCW27_00055 [Patescibacteria group bacterium]|jgi:hypothetical protein